MFNLDQYILLHYISEIEYFYYIYTHRAQTQYFYSTTSHRQIL